MSEINEGTIFGACAAIWRVGKKHVKHLWFVVTAETQSRSTVNTVERNEGTIFGACAAIWGVAEKHVKHLWFVTQCFSLP